jgi:hypothetical protein
MNHTRVDFNILRPHTNRPEKDARAVLDNLRSGKCHQVYGISDFNQNARLGGIKYHEKFQTAYGNDQAMFKRKNGEFTNHQDNLSSCKF